MHLLNAHIVLCVTAIVVKNIFMLSQKHILGGGGGVASDNCSVCGLVNVDVETSKLSF